MKILVVITSYKVASLTIDCLQSISKEVSNIPNLKVGICDNGNDDNTEEQLMQAIKNNGWEEWAYLRSIKINRGFSGGNNIILREALCSDDPPDLFLLLNADTIVRSGAITSLLRAAIMRSDVGIFCPRLEWPSGDPQISAFHFITPISEMLAAAKTRFLTKFFRRWEVPLDIVDEPMEIDWGSFACALIRKEVFHDIGVLDEGYYLYFDDVDFCHSAHRAGWKVLYWPDARIVHLRGKSNPVKARTTHRKRRPQYWYQSRSWYLSKFYGKPYLLAANILWLVGRTVSLLRELSYNKEPHLCEKEAFDIWKGFLRPVKPQNNVTENRVI